MVLTALKATCIMSISVDYEHVSGVLQLYRRVHIPRYQNSHSIKTRSVVSIKQMTHWGAKKIILPLLLLRIKQNLARMNIHKFQVRGVRSTHHTALPQEERGKAFCTENPMLISH